LPAIQISAGPAATGPVIFWRVGFAKLATRTTGELGKNVCKVEQGWQKALKAGLARPILSRTLVLFNSIFTPKS